MDEKLILVNKTDLPTDVFLRLVGMVVDGGRISNDGKQYCYLTIFKVEGVEYSVYSDLNKKSDKFTLVLH